MRDEKEPTDCPRGCPAEMVETERQLKCPKCGHVIEKSEPSPVDSDDIYERRV